MDDEAISVARSVGADLALVLQDAERQSRSNSGTDQLTRMISGALDMAMARLRDLHCWGPDNRMASNEFWRIAEPWLRHGVLQVHARSKPRGYAGDFELLAKICDRVCCAHPLGTAMDHYFQNQAAPQAVRERTELLAQRLTIRSAHGSKDPFRVVSVGSGPAREMLWAAQRMSADQRSRLQVTLLDLDPLALDYAAACLTPLLGEQGVTCVRANVARLPQSQRLARHISGADYLFCCGFFDYLEAAAAGAMLHLFWRSLAPEGQLTVFNFSPTNPSRAYMEWIGNWYLTYRDESQMRQLAESSGMEQSCVHVHSVSQGALVELSAARGDSPR